MKNICLALGAFVFSVWGMAQSNTSVAESIALEGTVNFRDLGGYQTENGARVKKGKIYRSAAMDKLTKADWTVLKQRNIRAVIDFRGRAEAAAAPDNLPPGVAYKLCSAGSNGIVPADGSLLKNPAEIPEFLNAFYRQVDSLGMRYKPLFEDLLNQQDNQALLFHCTAGRDRTGLASVLLLYILGVGMDDIIADYLVSNAYLEASLLRQMEQSGLTEAQSAELVQAMELKPEYLYTTYYAIVDTYGSIDAFVETQLGIGALETQLLRAKYTE